MKAIIAIALRQMIETHHGKEKWDEILAKSKIDKNSMLFQIADMHDESVMKMINITCDVLGITLNEAADAFGDFWVNEFTQKQYGFFYRKHKTAKDFLLFMDKLHYDSTKLVPGSNPPRFEYEWMDDHTLIITYKSHRKLIQFLIGLIKGVGKFYHEDLKVTKLNDKNLKIVFSKTGKG